MMLYVSICDAQQFVSIPQQVEEHEKDLLSEDFASDDSDRRERIREAEMCMDDKALDANHLVDDMIDFEVHLDESSSEDEQESA